MSMSKEDAFYQKVRLIQRRTRCSNYVCAEFVKIYRKMHAAQEGKEFATLKSFDTKCKNAAASNYLVLHGCPSCNKYIYLGPTGRMMIMKLARLLKQMERSVVIRDTQSKTSLLRYVCHLFNTIYTEQNEPFEVCMPFI